MAAVSSINLVLAQSFQLLLSSGASAGQPLKAGNYVAEPNVGQQAGTFSLYEADASFVKGTHVANVHLTVAPNGQVFLMA
ncbi:hypothetical protein [Novosphingobium naphthalenivorans]|uniref:hypothetical protein n=1 Tax=Novosphingobium naphthalenivorans TaxID=273168 RepID=UPI000831697B|nr:hypothetical protein [Novosphingobium naphthalenivorans]